MAAEYLEIQKQMSGAAERFCECVTILKILSLSRKAMMTSYDELWHTKNSFIIPVNYIEPVPEYTKQNDLFQLKKTPEKTSRQQESPYAPRYY